MLIGKQVLQMLNYVEKQINSNIDHTVVICRFIDKIINPDCPKELCRIAYVTYKLAFRIKVKKAERNSGTHQKIGDVYIDKTLNDCYDVLDTLRKAYYRNKCICGKCNTKHDLIRYYNTKLEVR